MDCLIRSNIIMMFNKWYIFMWQPIVRKEKQSKILKRVLWEILQGLTFQFNEILKPICVLSTKRKMSLKVHIGKLWRHIMSLILIILYEWFTMLTQVQVAIWIKLGTINRCVLISMAFNAIQLQWISPSPLML